MKILYLIPVAIIGTCGYLSFSKYMEIKALEAEIAAQDDFLLRHRQELDTARAEVRNLERIKLQLEQASARSERLIAGAREWYESAPDGSKITFDLN